MTMNTRWLNIKALALSLAFMCSCSMVGTQQADKSLYALSVSRPEGGTAQLTDRSLRVFKFRVSPRYEGRNLVYRASEAAYESDYYSEFLIPPGQIMTEEVRRWLDESGMFARVINTVSQVMPEYVLEGAVNALYGDFRDSARPLAVLEVQLFLIDHSETSPRIVVQKEYAEKIVLKDRDADTLVQGWNQALTRIMTDFEAGLRAAQLD